MFRLQKILNRINCSRAEEFRQPLIENREEALELSREIGAAMDRLDEDQKILFLATLAEINQALAARQKVLSGDLEVQGSRLDRMQRTMTVCRKYADSLSLDVAPRNQVPGDKKGDG